MGEGRQRRGGERHCLGKGDGGSWSGLIPSVKPGKWCSAYRLTSALSAYKELSEIPVDYGVVSWNPCYSLYALGPAVCFIGEGTKPMTVKRNCLMSVVSLCFSHTHVHTQQVHNARVPTLASRLSHRSRLVLPIGVWCLVLPPLPQG